MKNKCIKYAMVLLAILMVACTTTKYVPVERVEKEYINTIQIDTCIIRDSIFTQKYNDTIYLEKYKYIYQNKIIKDTVIVKDTIPIVKTVEVIKETNVIKNWQMLLMVLGGVFITFILFKIKSIFKL